MQTIKIAETNDDISIVDDLEYRIKLLLQLIVLPLIEQILKEEPHGIIY